MVEVEEVEKVEEVEEVEEEGPSSVRPSLSPPAPPGATIVLHSEY